MTPNIQYTFVTMISRESLLQNLTFLATQICNNRRWVPGKIVELLDNPTNAGVLGRNIQKGNIIQIRLYDNGNQIEWYHLVGTLAHELAHNLFANHSPEFYKEMNKIHDEFEKLDDYEKIFSEMTGSYYSKGYSIVSKGANTKSTTCTKSICKDTREQRRSKILTALHNRGLV